jgi:opacity protein-like surface antigen
MKTLGGLITAALAVLCLALALPAEAETTYTRSAGEYVPTSTIGKDLPLLAASRWSGFHLGGHVGWSRSGTRGSLVTPAGPIPGVVIDGDHDDALIGGVSAGGDVQIGRMVLGIAGDWTVGTSAAGGRLLVGGAPLATADFKVRDSYAIVARAGFLVHDAVLVYALAGHTWANTSGLSIAAPGGAVSFAMPDMAGWTFGGGVEWQPPVMTGFAVKIEYRFTDFARERVDLMPALTLGNAHVDHSVRFGLAYRFGGLGQ